MYGIPKGVFFCFIFGCIYSAASWGQEIGTGQWEKGAFAIFASAIAYVLMRKVDD